MSSLVQRIFSKKRFYIPAIFILIYVLLRVITLFQHKNITLPGDYFTFQDKQVRYVCKGQGAPYVFFETGFGSDSEVTWSAIVQELPNNFTACYYDRLGHGGSDNVPTTFSTDEKALLQESLIQHVAGKEPVVLVAHSYGGIIARRTVARGNINFSALILLDSAHENQHEVMRGKLDPIQDSVKLWHYADATFGISAIKNIFTTYNSPTSQRLSQYYTGFSYAHVLSTYRNEKGFYTPLEDFNYDFGNLKMLVLSHDKQTYANNPRFAPVVDDWEKMQKSIAKLSNNSERIIVKGATHNIPGDAPNTVTSTIVETVSLASSNS